MPKYNPEIPPTTHAVVSVSIPKFTAFKTDSEYDLEVKKLQNDASKVSKTYPPELILF